MRNLLVFLVLGALAWQGCGEYRTREARITATGACTARR